MFSKKTIILIIVTFSVLFFVSRPFSVSANLEAPKPDAPDVVQWVQVPSGTAGLLNQVDFITPSIGWVSGFDTILSTDDGGVTWNLQDDPDGPDYGGVSFISENEGWLTGKDFDDGTLTIHTTNGGQDWDVNLEGVSNIFPGKISFVDSSNGWRSFIRMISFFKFEQKIGESQDGGLTWTDLTTNIEKANGFHLLPTGKGWIVGSDGDIASRDSFGEVFTDQTSHTSEMLYDVFFLNDQQGWAVGENGIIVHTANGGDLWQVQTSNTSEHLNAVFFLDVNTGWAVGDNGTIVHTENGGTSWLLQPSGVTEILYSIDFPERNNGWVVGYNGTLLHYHAWDVFLPLLLR